jgi:methionine biosynthesis protein MetW
MPSENFDIPGVDENREYDYSSKKIQHRAEYEYIVDFVRQGSKVIDLGCGNGSLLELLRDKKKIEAHGIELSESGVDVCKGKNLNVLQGRIDTKLSFDDDYFDYAICNVTVQMVMYPEVLISEMKRIAKYQIISFPNFAFYRNRIELLINGTMPKSMLFGYNWYNTGHIHQFSIKDFLGFVKASENFTIVDWKHIPDSTGFKKFLMTKFPNLFQLIPIFLLEAKK